MAGERPRQAAWVKRATEPVCKNEVAVLVGVGREVALEPLGVTVDAQSVDGLAVKGERPSIVGMCKELGLSTST